jgi:predicted nucleic acid-binding protein
MRRHAVLADTGPLYASVDPDDQYHGRARQEGERLATEGYAVVIPYPTLFESYSLVLQRMGVRTAYTFLTELRERSGLHRADAE